MMERRQWIESGLFEELDERQVKFLELVLEQVRHYYKSLYRTAPRFRYPLSLSRLAKLCNRSVYCVSLAVRILGNTVKPGQSRPEITYERGQSKRHKAKRPFRIFLK
jgi:hypothetical protein